MDLTCTRLVLVRHAQHHTAVDDGGLTDLGRAQGVRLAGALPTGAARTSPARRATETAAAAGVEAGIVPGLAEFVFGQD